MPIVVPFQRGQTIIERVPPRVRGRIGLYRCYGDRSERLFRKSNQVQYTWGHIAAMTIGRGLRNYRVSAMYMEFANVADPVDAVAVPSSFGREEDMDYYADLALSPDHDYLRVPLAQDPMVSIEAGYEAYFPEGTGNKLTFFALSQGTQGVHGKTFSDSVNSKLVGLALVATPVWADRTQDIVFARTYFDVADQALKEASHQIGSTWETAFE